MYNRVEEDVILLIHLKQIIEGRTDFSERAHKNCTGNYCFYYGKREEERCSWARYMAKVLQEVTLTYKKQKARDDEKILSEFSELLAERGYSRNSIRKRLLSVDIDEADREILHSINL